jgi:hypothetical protein
MERSPKQQLGSPEGLAWVRCLVGENPNLSRYGLAREVCERLDWRSETGRLKGMACRKHLLHLDRGGEIVLPPARRERPQRCRDPAPPPAPEFSGTLAGVGEIELQVVSGGTAASRHWNAVMEAHHRQGSGPLCGAQLRYLIVSSRLGVVGGLAVSAPAWRLGVRDDWLGWSDAVRAQNLSGIVCNSRFLILPTIRVKHLASHVLGLLSRRIAGDWQRRYGIRPWLMESYVEAWRAGTVYRAANWIEVGMTAGRGRQDRGHKRELSPKRVFLYPLCRAALARLCGKRPPSEPGWVHREFGGAKLGDRRLQQRLLGVATAFFNKPTAGIVQACGSWAAAKAAYRFFDHERATMEVLLEPHRSATVERMRREPVVLVVQDSSSLNYTTHRDMRGIGPIGNKVNGPQGLILHNMLAFRPDGLPLGILDVQCWNRDPANFGAKKQRQTKAIQDKESYKWLRPLACVREAARRCPDTRVVTVTDAEGDIYEFFDEANKQGCQLLVRAREDRAIDGSCERLWAHMQNLPQAGEVQLHVPRRAKQPARIARMSVRFAEITLKPPTKKPHLPPMRLWAVSSKEIDAPHGVEALEWMLLTAVPTTSLHEAFERVQWYAARWGIEVFHRVLKSGCQIEDRQLATADRLEACLAIDMVVAWRIHHLTWLGRATPDLPCTVAFDQDQWKAILVFNTHKPPPDQPPTLAHMIRLIAKLGGFLGRTADKEPGTENFWRGLQRMDDITLTFRSMLAAYRPQPP